MTSMDLRDFQQLIEKMYSHKDRERGPAGTFLWLMEEVGELAEAIAEILEHRPHPEEVRSSPAVRSWDHVAADVCHRLREALGR